MKKRFALGFLIFFLLLLCGCRKECSHELMTNKAVDPACDQPGYTLHSCSQCSYQYKSDTVPPKGHVFSSTIFEPTCEEEGYTHYYCTCGYQYKGDFTVPTGHILIEQIIAPTCEKGGYSQMSCSLCELTYQAHFTEPKGHQFTDQVTLPTCTEGGFTTRSCTVCLFRYQSAYTPPKGHQITETVTVPTCVKEGYTLQTCSDCSFSHQAKRTAPTGHRYTPAITHPTRQESGGILYTCNCGHSYTNHLFYSDVFRGAAVTENQTILAKGVDVSMWQHTVRTDGSYAPLNWSLIREAGFDFAILKAGSTIRGTAGGKDPVFEMNYRDAKSVGMELGVYFYTYASTPQGIKDDALMLISWLQDKQLEYPVYFDLEDPSLASLGKDTLTEFCDIFISTLQENGFYGALYSNNSWLTEYLHQDTLRNVYDIWYARYPSSSEDSVLPTASYTWNTEKYGTHMGLWQYTQYGVIEGIDGVSFDFNYAYRDYPALIQKFGYNGYKVQG